MKNERLKAWLRAGDPAGEGSPGPVEIARMRAAMLAEAAAASMRPRPLRALAGATALAAAAAGLALAAWLVRSGPAAMLPPELGGTAVTWAPPAPAPALLELVERGFERPTYAAQRSVRSAPEPRSQRLATQTTTVRFTTRRGTQIIWTLDPRIEL